MEVWAAHYQLRPRSSLSAKASSAGRNGALLKLVFENGPGFADLFPWPELGDRPLNEQIQLLASGQLTPLTARAIEFARIDAEARARSVSVFKGLAVPDSHALVTELSACSSQSLQDLADKGFTHLKLKLGRARADEHQVLSQRASELTRFRLRLDFNCSFGSGPAGVAGALMWLDRIPNPIRDAIEFIEDPLVWDPEHWQSLSGKSGTPLALDRLDERQLTELARMQNRPACKWMVFKPALQRLDAVVALARQHSLQVCATSYLGHPLGQTAAAFSAACAIQQLPGQVGVCGLLSQAAYEENEYSRLLPTAAQWAAQSEPGLGFSELLQREEWQPIGEVGPL